MRVRHLILSAALAGGTASLAAQVPAYSGPTFTRTEVAPGVYVFVFDNALSGGANVDGTGVAIINDEDVVVVDAQWTPASSKRVLDEIRKLTTKPVRYVVTTHWHGDHWFGNQTYRNAFSGVEFIAHPNTLIDLLEEELPDIDTTQTRDIPAMIESAQGSLAKGVGRSGRPMTAADSQSVLKQIGMLQWAKAALHEIVPVTPTLTVADSLVLIRGQRRIVVQYIGRGNTRGDLSVWLPNERVLVTGDLLVNPAPYAFGSFPSDWVRTLTALRTLPARVVVPGHGAIQYDWAYLDLVVEALRATIEQASAAVAKGLDLEATRKAIDLSAIRQKFAKADPQLERAFDGFFVAPVVERAWLEARGEIDRHPR